MIVTGGSQGVGLALVKTFLKRDYNVVATSRNISNSEQLPSSLQFSLVDGDIGIASTAEKIIETAVTKYGSLEALVNNAGVFFTKLFINYTAENIKQFVSTNMEGFIYITQLSRC